MLMGFPFHVIVGEAPLSNSPVPAFEKGGRERRTAATLEPSVRADG